MLPEKKAIIFDNEWTRHGMMLRNFALTALLFRP